LACPVFDHEQNIIGYQLRLDGAIHGRYRWAKGKYPSHLKNSELPITVARPVADKPIGVAMAEGILKPFVAAQIHKKVFLGASGANFSSSPQQVKIYLEATTKEVETKIIDFYPDSGAVGTPMLSGHTGRRLTYSKDLVMKFGSLGGVKPSN
jgi:hypothetical protein